MSVSSSSSSAVPVAASSSPKAAVTQHVDPTASLSAPQIPAEDSLRQLAAQIAQEKVYREQAIAIFNEKGNAGVQATLQKLIQDTKKLESDLALKRKKVEKERIARLNISHETTTILEKARIYESHCARIAENIRTWPERREKKVEELKETMTRIRGNIDKEADKLTKEMDEKEKRNDEIDAENEKLQAEFDVLKDKLDAEFGAYQDRNKVQDERTTMLRKSLEASQDKTNHLRAEAMVYGRELHTLEEQIVGYTETCKMYTDKFGQLENTAMTTEQIEEAIGKQKAAIRDHIEAVEKDKKLDVEEKIKFDNDAKNLRQKIQQLKKKIPTLEKAKSQAEAQYRAAVQAKLKKESATSL